MGHDLVQELAEARLRLDQAMTESAHQLRIMRSRFEALQTTMRGAKADEARVAARDRIAALSNRERDVLKAIAEGCSTKEIAFQLNITFKTAVSHRTRLMQKLEIHETASLVRLAIRAGLVPLDQA